MTSKQIERLRNADILVLMSLLWFLILFLRYILPPLFPTFQEQYAITTVELGLAYSGLLFAYAVMQFPAGWVADRIGKVNMITTGGLVFVFSTLLIAISTTWAVLLGGILLIGLGTGGHKILSPASFEAVYRFPGPNAWRDGYGWPVRWDSRTVCHYSRRPVGSELAHDLHYYGYGEFRVRHFIPRPRAASGFDGERRTRRGIGPKGVSATRFIHHDVGRRRSEIVFESLFSPTLSHVP